MEAILFIVVVYGLFKFNRALTTLTKAFNTSANIADDTVGTYANEVHILNAGKRTEQKSALEDLGEIVTINEITKILAGKSEKEEAAS